MRSFHEIFEDVERKLSRIMEDIEGFKTPLVDIKETKSGIEIYVDLPGVEGSEIDIEAEDRALVIRAEAKKDDEKKGESYHIRERRLSRFFRRIDLPVRIDPKSVKASYKNGVLVIKAKKGKKGKVIKVK